MIIDLFTYTEASSNGSLSIEKLIEAAKESHLDGIAITDQATSNRAGEYAEKASRSGIFVAQGVELMTSAGKVVAFPQTINESYIREDWRELGECPEVEAVLEYFHERGGVVVARDIYNCGAGLKDRVYSAKDSHGHGFDAVDTVSARRRRIDNELSIEAQQVLGVAACAGSGAEQSEEVGHCATLFASDISDQASFVAAIRNPLHWACALRDLGDACPMGSAPRMEEDGRRRDDRRGGDRHYDDRRGDRRDDRRGGERRYGRDRNEHRDHDDNRRGSGDRRRGGERRDDRRGGGRRHDDRRGPRR